MTKAKPKGPPKKMGAPTTYTPEKAKAICELVAQGKFFSAACREIGENPGVVWKWKNWYADFDADYARAREVRADAQAEEILEISDDASGDVIRGEDGSEVVNHARIQRDKLKIDTRRWLMARLQPKRYGDKIEHSGQIDGVAPVVNVALIPPDALVKLAAVLEEVAPHLPVIGSSSTADKRKR